MVASWVLQQGERISAGGPGQRSQGAAVIHQVSSKIFELIVSPFRNKKHEDAGVKGPTGLSCL